MPHSVRDVVLRAAVVAALVCAAARTVAGHAAPKTADLSAARCGSDELETRTIGTRVSALSRVAAPEDGRVVEAAATAWQPIRIAVFTDDISDSSRYCSQAGQTRPNFEGSTVTCGSGDILTSAKKQVLLEFLIPSAVQLHEERLMVQPESGNIVVDTSISSDSICGQFTIPASHMTTGVANADFVLYMAAGPTSGAVIGWATSCQYFSNGRPSVGVANVSPKYLTAEPQTVRVVAHELLHALGFIAWNFNALGMNSTANVRGKTGVPVMVSANVVAQARTQYGCTTQTYMEIEDMGSSGTAGSHWKRRSAKDEMMAGISGAGYYTALTIAAMEDMGYYKGNYTLAEPMVYGQNAGCSLTTSECVSSGSSQFPSMFCDSVNTNMVCASDHRGIGYCALGEYTTALPSIFQYFSDPKEGGTDPLMDYCPYVQAYGNANCTVDKGVLVGSVFGVMSRCFDATSGVSVGGTSYVQYGVCAEVQCDSSSSTYGVLVSGASTYTSCPAGNTLSLTSLSGTFSGGQITCPSYNTVCGEELNATLYEKYIGLLNGDGARGVPACVAAAVALVALVLAVV